MGSSIGTEVMRAGGVNKPGAGVARKWISNWLQLGAGAGAARKHKDIQWEHRVNGYRMECFSWFDSALSL